jgi:hypothetical protein
LQGVPCKECPDCQNPVPTVSLSCGMCGHEW